MLHGELTTILATHEHFLGAKVATHGERLVQVLNDGNTRFLSLTDVQVFRREGGTHVATLPRAVIQKDSIALAIPAVAGHESPRKRRDNYIQKSQFHTLVLVLGYEVRGRLWLKGTEDPVSALCRELGTFFPITDGVVAFAGKEGDQHGGQVVLVNRNLISLFQIGEHVREKPGPVLGAETAPSAPLPDAVQEA
jgi:hypothetical protein